MRENCIFYKLFSLLIDDVVGRKKGLKNELQLRAVLHICWDSFSPSKAITDSQVSTHKCFFVCIERKKLRGNRNKDRIRHKEKERQGQSEKKWEERDTEREKERERERE